MVKLCLLYLGLQGINIETYKVGMMISIIGTMGYFLTLHVMAEIISNFSYSNTGVLNFKENMRNMKSFLKLVQIPKQQQDLIINHYNLKWNKEKGRNIFVLTKYLHNPLKEDVMYEIHGRKILAYVIFPKKHKEIFKNIVLESHYRTFPNGATIISKDDVSPYLYIICEGYVSLDINDEIKTLGVGAMFGNFDGTEYKRMEFVAVATGHVEILSIHSNKFMSIVTKQPECAYLFSTQLATFKFYIPGIIDMEPASSLSNSKVSESSLVLSAQSELVSTH